ncbi:MAG: hypothetical protein AAGF83_14810 [Cyanobacteria bacterium P01_G01_bin.67]
MRSIYVAYEAQTVQYANFLSEILQEYGYHTLLLPRKAFPIADAMTLYFYHLNSQYNTTFVIIASDRSISWISKELIIQRNMGNCLNVYPAFIPTISIPDWWINEEAHYLLINPECRDKIEFLLS